MREFKNYLQFRISQPAAPQCIALWEPHLPVASQCTMLWDLKIYVSPSATPHLPVGSQCTMLWDLEKYAVPVLPESGPRAMCTGISHDMRCPRAASSMYWENALLGPGTPTSQCSLHWGLLSQVNVHWDLPRSDISQCDIVPCSGKRNFLSAK